MSLSFLIGLLVVLLIWMGIRSILRDWRRKFAEDDARAQARRKEQIERNKAEVKSGGIVTLERGEDGVYRPGKE